MEIKEDNLRTLSWLILAGVGFMLAACTATPPKSTRVSYDPLLAEQAGTLLIVDACVQRDELGDSDDYFVISEAKAGAHAALSELRKYIKDSAIPVRDALIPFVCGAKLKQTSLSIRAADSLKSPVHDARQPLAVSADISSDPQYIAALSILSTYLSQNTGGLRSHANIDKTEFHNALALIKARTQASSILYLGARGISRSGGKATAQAIGSIVAGTVAAIAVVPPSDFSAMNSLFLPDYPEDRVVMRGALVDLKNNKIAWSKTVQVKGDPIKHPGIIGNPNAIHLLFHDVIFKRMQDQ